MTVLITRSNEDGIEIASEIRNLGIEVLSEPLIDFVIYPPNNEIDYSPFQAFVFTSKNAVRYLKTCAYGSILNKQCFAIGDATANMLRDLGFSNVLSADNDINKLIQNVRLSCVSKVFYFRGEEISLDLKEVFSSHKSTCDECICYKVEKIEKFSNALVKKMISEDIKVVLFFSKNTAKSFLSLCNKYDIAKFMKKVTILTVSYKLRDELKGMVTNSIESFEGRSDSLLELIKLYYV
jgi:uroporphyrinogen-III synthase